MKTKKKIRQICYFTDIVICIRDKALILFTDRHNRNRCQLPRDKWTKVLRKTILILAIGAKITILSSLA